MHYGVCELCGDLMALVLKTNSKIIEAKHRRIEYLFMCKTCMECDICSARLLYFSGKSFGMH